MRHPVRGKANIKIKYIPLMVTEDHQEFAALPMFGLYCSPFNGWQCPLSDSFKFERMLHGSKEKKWREEREREGEQKGSKFELNWETIAALLCFSRRSTAKLAHLIEDKKKLEGKRRQKRKKAQNYSHADSRNL